MTCSVLLIQSSFFYYKSSISFAYFLESILSCSYCFCLLLTFKKCLIFLFCLYWVDQSRKADQIRQDVCFPVFEEYSPICYKFLKTPVRFFTMFICLVQRLFFIYSFRSIPQISDECPLCAICIAGPWLETH